MHGINVIGYIDLGAHALWVLFFGQELHMEVRGGNMNLLMKWGYIEGVIRLWGIHVGR